ncbi:unnamed protein product [Schistocephalus solidus]|uniref:Non-specific serine/threonine protein kinase n=1 Tax=Schistocephalus solidus TaxID=70667 RepID=A0A183SHF9_SCHSO|nr:unnamed protein product [Schistocephalus solidus]
MLFSCSEVSNFQAEALSYVRFFAFLSFTKYLNKKENKNFTLPVSSTGLSDGSGGSPQVNGHHSGRLLGAPSELMASEDCYPDSLDLIRMNQENEEDPNEDDELPELNAYVQSRMEALTGAAAAPTTTVSATTSLQAQSLTLPLRGETSFDLCPARQVSPNASVCFEDTKHFVAPPSLRGDVSRSTPPNLLPQVCITNTEDQKVSKSLNVCNTFGSSTASALSKRSPHDIPSIREPRSISVARPASALASTERYSFGSDIDSKACMSRFPMKAESLDNQLDQVVRFGPFLATSDPMRCQSTDCPLQRNTRQQPLPAPHLGHFALIGESQSNSRFVDNYNQIPSGVAGAMGPTIVTEGTENSKDISCGDRKSFPHAMQGLSCLSDSELPSLLPPPPPPPPLPPQLSRTTVNSGLSIHSVSSSPGARTNSISPSETRRSPLSDLYLSPTATRAPLNPQQAAEVATGNLTSRQSLAPLPFRPSNSATNSNDNSSTFDRYSKYRTQTAPPMVGSASDCSDQLDSLFPLHDSSQQPTAVAATSGLPLLSAPPHNTHPASICEKASPSTQIPSLYTQERGTDSGAINPISYDDSSAWGIPLLTNTTTTTTSTTTTTTAAASASASSLPISHQLTSAFSLSNNDTATSVRGAPGDLPRAVLTSSCSSPLIYRQKKLLHPSAYVSAQPRQQQCYISISSNNSVVGSQRYSWNGTPLTCPSSAMPATSTGTSGSSVAMACPQSPTRGSGRILQSHNGTGAGAGGGGQDLRLPQCRRNSFQGLATSAPFNATLQPVPPILTPATAAAVEHRIEAQNDRARCLPYLGSFVPRGSHDPTSSTVTTATGAPSSSSSSSSIVSSSSSLSAAITMDTPFSFSPFESHHSLSACLLCRKKCQRFTKVALVCRTFTLPRDGIRSIRSEQRSEAGLRIGSHPVQSRILGYADRHRDEQPGICITYRTDGHLLNSRRMQASTHVSTTTVHDLLFADDCALNTVLEEDMQRSMDLFATGCADFGLTISTAKSVVMPQPPPSAEYSALRINVNGDQLKNVENFAYLGSPLSRNTRIDDEVAQRISKASQTFGRLQASVWNRHGIHLNTKLEIIRDSVLTTGSGGGGGESGVAAAQGYYHLNLIHAQVTVPAPPGVEHTVDLVKIDGRTVISLITRLSTPPPLPTFTSWPLSSFFEG